MSTSQRQKSFGGGNPLLGKIKGNHAQSLLSVIAGIFAFGMAFLGISSWLLNIENQSKIADTKLDMMSLAYNQSQKVQNAGYKEALGKRNTSTQAVKGKYTVTTTYGDATAPVPFDITVTSSDNSIPAYTVSNTVSVNQYGVDEINEKLDAVDAQLDKIQKQINDYYKDH